MKTPRPSLFGRCAAAAVLAAGLLAGTIAGPAAADAPGPKPPADYVALGDSYAAGFGAGPYLNACGQSPLGLPGLLDQLRKVELTYNATCSGAKAAADRTDAVPDVPEQLEGLVLAGLIGADTDLVTVSAGGNDLGFGAVVGACATQLLAVCEQVIDGRTLQAQTTLAAALDDLYGNLRAAAPEARIVVTGYPHLFSPKSGSELLLSTEAQQLFNEGTDALNTVIRQNAKANGLHYVDVVQRFKGHGIGTRDPWITYTGFTAIDDLHPNAEGYQSGYLKSVRSEVGALRK
ncbi:SGNH/GDSL hydrolase family protein [Arthrobacter sp. H20]|uniref:SGNH/GDSL hydrolase family protein n=1 Tax=Arthrobacter sp. H20 TaxID=1267981 RepID=UPI0004AECD16|nr:SGNH/GDSL hydrolase family protein [Arthrobacter sp. H20]